MWPAPARDLNLGWGIPLAIGREQLTFIPYGVSQGRLSPETRDTRRRAKDPPRHFPCPPKNYRSREYAAFITKPGDTNVPGQEGTVTAPQTQDKVQTQTNLMGGAPNPKHLGCKRV